jgi:Concanavalin A-like lectin/glucanases superfamily
MKSTIALVLLVAITGAGCSDAQNAPKKRPAASGPATPPSPAKGSEAKGTKEPEAAPAKKNVYRGPLLEMTGEEESPVKVWNPQGKRVLDPYYELEKKGLALVGKEYSLRLEGGSFLSGGAEEYLGGGLRNAAGELTLCAYVHPAAADQKGAGCITVYAPRGGDPLFALMQEKDTLTLKISAGQPAAVTIAKLKSTKPFHLAVTVGKKQIVFYRDGKKAGTHSGIKGDFSAWKDGRLYFGNNQKGTRPWRGRIEKAVLYNKALGADDVAKLASAVLEEMRDRESAPRIELIATLLKRSTYRMPWGENTYREALSVCEYQVKKVIRGKYTEKKIRVAELMYVDRIFLTNSRKKIGTEHRLVVEEFDDNPQMAKIERGDSLDLDIDAGLYVELSPLQALPKNQQPKPKKDK